MRKNIVILLALVSTTTSAGTVYKCLGENGKYTYQDTVCSEHTASKIELESKPMVDSSSEDTVRSNAEWVQSERRAYEKRRAYHAERADERARRIDRRRQEEARERRHQELMDALTTPIWSSRPHFTRERLEEEREERQSKKKLSKPGQSGH